MRKILGVILLMVLTACSNLPDSAMTLPDVNEEKKMQVAQYFIGVDDVVAVNVWKNPDLSVSVPVRPDGKISVPLIGEVVAGGKTPLEVTQDIRAKLSKFIRDPKVSVILEELNSHAYLSRVRITGAVETQLSISYRQGMTVLDIVLEAGGLNEFASANSTKLFRRVNDKINKIDIRLSDILNDGDMSTNYPIQPGDILSVPERVF